jgi:uncharacterized protein DUF3592
MMALLDRFRNKKEDETSRAKRLLRTGRIVEGRVLDVASDGSGNDTQVFYSYNIAGVEYESSQTLNSEQRRRKADYAPGARVVIRYDPHQPANSIVV